MFFSSYSIHTKEKGKYYIIKKDNQFDGNVFWGTKFRKGKNPHATDHQQKTDEDEERRMEIVDDYMKIHLVES